MWSELGIEGYINVQMVKRFDVHYPLHWYSFPTHRITIDLISIKIPSTMSPRLVDPRGGRHIQKSLFAAFVTGSKGANFQRLSVVNTRLQWRKEALTNFEWTFISSGIAAIASAVIGGQNCEVVGS